jgi:hypothetical protein
MFNEVRIYDSNNHIKRIIPTKELSKKYWMSFEEKQNKNLSSKIKKKIKKNNLN